jgi:hypothetical protein
MKIISPQKVNTQLSSQKPNYPAFFSFIRSNYLLEMIKKKSYTGHKKPYKNDE